MAACQDLCHNEDASAEELEALLLESCRHGNRDVVESLLSKGVRLDIRDRGRRTPFVLSCMFGFHQVVELILDHGFDIPSEDGKAALVEACMKGHLNVVKTLAARGFDLSGRYFDRSTALMWACKIGRDKLVEILIGYLSNVNDTDVQGKTGFMWACRNGHDKVVEILIRRVSDINMKDKRGKTAVMEACVRGHDKVVELLLKHSADVSEMDDGRTSLMWACIFGFDKVVEVLLQHVIDVNEKDDIGKTALSWACFKGHDKSVKLLMEHGARVDFSDQDGDTPLSDAVGGGFLPVVEMLLKEGVAINTRDVYCGATPFTVACNGGYIPIAELLLEKGADINARSNNGTTALMEACGSGCLSIVQALVRQGVCVNAGSDARVTPLMEACGTGTKKIRWKDDWANIVQLLIEHGAVLDKQDLAYGRSAVIIAVRDENVKCLKAILPAGPNLDLFDKEGKTVFAHAIAKESTECLRILLEEGTLLSGGRMDPVHKNIKPVQFTKESLLVTVEFGVFEWEWCPLHYYKPITLAALESGISPGKIRCDFHTYLSPLVISALMNDTALTQTLLERLYYYPKDYRKLCTDANVRRQIRDRRILDKMNGQPLSLQTWCYLTVSKTISTSCFPVRRHERVDALPIPDMFKRRLNFK